jgi:hypothetical protein
MRSYLMSWEWIVISFAGPQQKTPADQGNWKIFIMMELVKSKYWPKTLSYTCDDEKNAYIIRSEQYHFMNAEDVLDLHKLLAANGFEITGDLVNATFRPSGNDVPRRVNDPNSIPFEYSDDEDEIQA